MFLPKAEKTNEPNFIVFVLSAHKFQISLPLASRLFTRCCSATLTTSCLRDFG
jgi:hypothetical protein